MCPIHHVYLVDSELRRGHETKTRIIPADHALEHGSSARRVDAKSQHNNSLVWLAEQSAWLLDHPCSRFDPSKLTALYATKLAAAGLARFGGTLHRERLLNQFQRRFPKSLLKQLGRGLETDKDRPNWLLRFLKTGDGNPLKHLLMIRFLGLTVESLQRELNRSQEFESGPWPCLNPVCDSSGKDAIASYRRHVRQRDGKSFGVFECPCGCSYLRCLPDVRGEFRKTPYKIVNRGRGWENALAALWEQDVPIAEIRRRLAASEQEVKAAVVTLQLPLKCRKIPPRLPEVERGRGYAKEAMMSKMVERVRQAIALNPSATRVDLREIHARREMKWAREHAPGLLDQVLPPSRRGYGHRPKRMSMDWTFRDMSLSAHVPAARKKLLQSRGAPVRISKHQLLVEIGYEHAVQWSTRLPRTIRALELAVESEEEFYDRRFRWFLGTINIGDERWTPTKLFRRAMVPSKWAKSPRFADLVAEALQRLGAYGRSVGDYWGARIDASNPSAA